MVINSNDGLVPPTPTFTNGHSGGFGVTYSTVQDPPGSGQTIYDTAPNQLNGTGSAFYDADMRDIEQPFDDAFVEFIAPRSGMGAVPYVHWASSPGPDFVTLNNLQRVWFKNKDISNYLHLIGAENLYAGQPTYAGGTPYLSGLQLGCSFIWVQMIETQKPTYTEQWVQYTTVHELTHNFSIQGGPSDGTYHCSNMAYAPPNDGLNCVMNAIYNLLVGTPPRFCIPHLETGGSTITDVHTSIRNQQDPLPY